MSALLQHLAGVKHLYQILALHAEAEMVLGHAEQALKDINVMFRIDDGLKDEPLLDLAVGADGELGDRVAVRRRGAGGASLVRGATSSLAGTPAKDRSARLNRPSVVWRARHLHTIRISIEAITLLREAGIVSNNSMSIVHSRKPFSPALTWRPERSIQASIIRLIWLSKNPTRERFQRLPPSQHHWPPC